MREWHIDLCVQWILRGQGRPPPSEWQVDLGVSWIAARPKGRPLAMAGAGAIVGKKNKKSQRVERKVRIWVRSREVIAWR